MSKYLPKAFVAIEDERFYEHSGVDVKRTIAATAKWALSKIHIGSASYGGSTITQQLVKNLTDEKERSSERKIKEMARAYYIEQELSKDQILELYLNLIFLGGKTYGVEVASNYYFNKSAADLDLAESAYLAGINNSPNSYNPFEDDTEEAKTAKMEKIKRRVKTVLIKMYELKDMTGITEEEYNEAMAKADEGLVFSEGQIIKNVYSYHTDATVNEVISEFMEKNDWTYEYAKLYVTSSGITIYSTQKTWIQKAMEEEFAKEKYIKTGKRDGQEYTTQAAMTIIDHATGKVVGTVGGLGQKTTAFGLNRATQSLRQTGSSMKPLAVLVPGIDMGIITGATGFDDLPGYYVGRTSVKNSTGYWGLRTTRYMIETSQNIPMAQAILKIGVEKSIKYLKDMGISSMDDEKDNYFGIALGGLTNGASNLEMAAAYAMIANDGVYIEPTFFIKVVDKDGNIILEPEQETRTVMSKAAAFVVKDILTQPVKGEHGTATFCRISGMSVAAKTGTTNSNYDRWLCGFTPYYAAACWFGYDVNIEVTGFGTNPAGQLWDNVMTNIHQGFPSKYFTMPAGVVTARVCACSGLLATEDCENDPRGSQTYTEYFVKGTAPTEYCNCHVKVNICTDTGLIANENCPNIETKIFLVRENADKDINWSIVKDNDYTLRIKDTCTVHTTPPVEEEPENPAGNTVEGNTVGGNETGGNTVGGNETGGNETGGNETSGNETGGNETGGNETGGNETSGNETSGNETGGNQTGENQIGGNETGGNE